MPVDSVGTADTAETYVRNTSKDSRKLNVDTETFLNLLVTQLKYQDPLAPQDNTQFVTQMAQMSSLSEMQDMSGSMKNSQAYSMIGKEIYAEVKDPTTNVTNQYSGVVDSVVLKDGIPYVVVGTQVISVDDVLQVFNPQTDSSSTDTGTPASNTGAASTGTNGTSTDTGSTATDTGSTSTNTGGTAPAGT